MRAAHSRCNGSSSVQAEAACVSKFSPCHIQLPTTNRRKPRAQCRSAQKRALQGSGNPAAEDTADHKLSPCGRFHLRKMMDSEINGVAEIQVKSFLCEELAADIPVQVKAILHAFAKVLNPVK